MIQEIIWNFAPNHVCSSEGNVAVKHVASLGTILLILTLGTTCPGFADDSARLSAFRVAGYLPDYRFAEFDFATTEGLTDLIIFSAEPTVDGGLNLERLKDCPWAKLLEHKTKHRIRLILTIGGWDRSTHFAHVAADANRRKAFVEAVVRLALQRRLDGIDIDWEHPKDAKEQESYGELLADLRAAFAPHGLILTVTVAAWQQLPNTAVDSVDYVQLMAYDHDKEHSTFEGARRDMEVLIAAKVPPAKIVIGLPFYGRNVESREAITYREIVTKFQPDPALDRVGQVYFNGPETIRRKVELAIESQLGGLMVWELGQDAPGDRSLLKVISTTVSRRNR